MARRIRIIIALLLLVAAVWNAQGQSWGLTGEVEAEAQASERQIRAFVMTQDIEYLRSQLIDLHKQHWRAERERAQQARVDFALWLAVGLAGAVLLAASLRRT